MLVHPFVIGELACGTLRQRVQVLEWLGDLPQATVAEDAEVLEMIEVEALWGREIGWVDAHLAASARLGVDQICTADRRLEQVCRDMGIAYAR